MTAERTWTADQLAAITERRAELVVSAAAGSGKTAVLIERVCRAALGLIQDGDGSTRSDSGAAVGIERMLVVTFTNAAAAELRSRLTEALNAAYARSAESGGAGRVLIREQLAALPRAQISTFHSFCADVVRRYGHLAGIGYEHVLAEDEAALLRHELATRFLDERLGEPGAEDARRLAMAWGGADGVGAEDLSRVRFGRGLRGRLLALLDFQRAQPDPQAWYRRCVAFGGEEFPPLDPANFDPAHPLISQLNASLVAWRDRAVATLEDLAGRLAQDRPSAKFIELVRRLVPRLRQLSLEGGWRETDGFIEQRLKERQQDIKHKPSLMQAYRRDLDRGDPWYERLKAEHEPIAKELNKWQKLVSQHWAEVAQAENETRRLLATLWRLAREFEGRYRDYKQQRGAVDFDDMQQLALRLLAARDGDTFTYDAQGWLIPSEVALELRRRFELVLVDEYQDTNEVQEAIINLVTRSAPAGPGGGGRPRFSVGDLKQSIYTFRLAVPQLFSAARERLSAMDERVGRVIKLQVNFRSRPGILAAINHVFNGLLTPELGGEDYSQNRLMAAEPDRLADGPVRPPADAELHLVVIERASQQSEDADVAAEGEDEEEADSGRLEAAYAHLAQVLIGLHGDRERPVRERGGGRRPAQWRDMAVLMRTTAGRIETLLSVCARAGLPVYAPGRSGFYERPEIADALALLRVIDNPRGDIALAAALSGPAAGLGYGELLSVARASDPRGASENDAPVDLWQRLLWYCDSGADTALAGRLAEFREKLRRWRDSARLDPLPELLWRLYAETGLLSAAAALSGGEQRVANLYRLHDLTRQAAGNERRGLTRFLRGLELSRRAAGDLGEAPLLTEAQDVVRVMSVHQSKGQEFPIVVVPDLDKQFNFQDLRCDVLWHRTAGAGGRWVHWPAPVAAGAQAQGTADVPRRADTLGYQLLKEARHRDVVSEELRILYVALTRARDRLVLIGAVDRQNLEKLPAEHRGEQARCWFDWVGPQLHDGVTRAREEGGVAACGPDGCWQVSVHTPDAARATRHVGLEPKPLEEGELAEIQRRLAQTAAGSPGLGLPLKMTVTRLAHAVAAPDGDDDALVAEAAAWPSGRIDVPRPAFIGGRAGAGTAPPSPAEIGTAAHLLLARLDLRREYQAEDVGNLRDKLAAVGLMRPAAAEALDPGAIVLAANKLREQLQLAEARLYRELPIALLVPAGDGALVKQLARAGISAAPPAEQAAGDAVYVQGVIDLLAVHGDTATVVDYKTDRGATAEELTARYAGQLGWYCRAGAALLPHCAVRWAIYGLDLAGLVGPVAWNPPA